MSSPTLTSTVEPVDFFDSCALSIAGERVESETTFEVFNPATGRVLAQAPDGTAHLDRAVAAARNAFPAWSALSWRCADYLRQYVAAIKAQKNDLARLLTLDPRR